MDNTVRLSLGGWGNIDRSYLRDNMKKDKVRKMVKRADIKKKGKGKEKSKTKAERVHKGYFETNWLIKQYVQYILFYLFYYILFLDREIKKQLSWINVEHAKYCLFAYGIFAIF
jgi:hypothetical protein